MNLRTTVVLLVLVAIVMAGIFLSLEQVGFHFVNDLEGHNGRYQIIVVEHDVIAPAMPYLAGMFLAIYVLLSFGAKFDFWEDKQDGYVAVVPLVFLGMVLAVMTGRLFLWYLIWEEYAYYAIVAGALALPVLWILRKEGFKRVLLVMIGALLAGYLPYVLVFLL